jgi:hypothetical protein
VHSGAWLRAGRTRRTGRSDSSGGRADLSTARVLTDGRHLSLGGRPHRIRGVTYGTFRPRADGQLFPEADRLAEDVAAMAAAGLNTVRTYTVPPHELLDAAAVAGPRVLVGVDYDDWRQHGTGRRARHCAAARVVAESCFSSDVVLPALLARMTAGRPQSSGSSS